MNQKPAFVLSILVPPGSYDVNITPDKREILLVNQADILGEHSINSLFLISSFILLFYSSFYYLKMLFEKNLMIFFHQVVIHFHNHHLKLI